MTRAGEGQEEEIVRYDCSVNDDGETRSRVPGGDDSGTSKGDGQLGLGCSFRVVNPDLGPILDAGRLGTPQRTLNPEGKLLARIHRKLPSLQLSNHSGSIR